MRNMIRRLKQGKFKFRYFVLHPGHTLFFNELFPHLVINLREWNISFCGTIILEDLVSLWLDEVVEQDNQHFREYQPYIKAPLETLRKRNLEEDAEVIKKIMKKPKVQQTFKTIK